MMFTTKKRQTRARRTATWVALCVFFVAALGFLGYQIRTAIGGDLRAQAVMSIEKTILERAVQCYAIEGAYPESLDYLEQNYGLQINRSDYFVTYEVFATNILPEVQVLEKP